MAYQHLHFGVGLLVVLFSLSQKGVHCQPPNEAKNPGCPAGQCNDTEICIDGQCLSRCISATSSDECEKCLDSLYGKRCENKCPPTCLNASCHLTDNSRVTCTEGCEAGMKGRKCNVPCSQNCLNCDRYGDECDSCVSGNYGHICTTICPENCAGQCDIATGECTCKPGFRGRCSKCKPGFRGRRCTIRCPAPCRSDCELGECHCEDGYTGDECEDSCPLGCEDGCDRDTGRCHTCKPGYMGDTCSERCPECSECMNETYNCSSCRTLPNCNGSEKERLMINAGIGLTVVAVIGCVLLVGFMVWKRRRERRETDNEKSEETVENNKMRMTELLLRDFVTTNPSYMLSRGEIKQVKYCQHFQGKDKEVRIEDEFQKLPPPDSRGTRCASMESNASKNRYKDVLPFDETRVSLEVWEDGTNDYINASFITGYRNQIQYVASQGPNVHVLDDFWRMIWQQNTTKIVMLTNLVEAGKIKCEMYWPFCSSDYQRYGRVCVQCVEEKVYQHHTLRTLAVWKDSAKTRTVLQFHFTSWPDHGVPDERSIIDFHRVVKNTGYNALAPLLIHCSAGVGRSGTFIALDFLLDQARYEGRVCIFNCIKQFRYQRMKMVQTMDQYRFLYDILVSALQYRGTLPCYYAPVVIECPVCWDRTVENSHQDEFTLEENSVEYQPLWNCGLAKRETYRPQNARLQPEACAIISENSPPLTSVISVDTEVEGQSDDLEKQRISWDTAM